MDKRKPNAKTTHFEVATNDGSNFRRADILFGPEAKTVEREALTDAQQVELLNTPVLRVVEYNGDERLTPAPTMTVKAKAAAKAAAKGDKQ